MSRKKTSKVSASFSDLGWYFLSFLHFRRDSQDGDCLRRPPRSNKIQEMEVFPYFSSLGKHFPYIFWACFAWNRRKGRNTSKTTRVKKCFINQWKLKILYWTPTILFHPSQKEALAQIRYGLYFEVLLPRYFGEILLFHQEQGFYRIYFC